MKNPLYVVKGQNVEEAKNVFDLIVKKLNLTPVITVFQNIIQMILENIKDYPTFLAMKKLLDNLIVYYFSFLKKFSLA